MTILLDIDGVLVTTPIWKPVEIHEDGFMKFDKSSSKNLATLMNRINPTIVLTSSHRTSYSITKWIDIFHARGIPVHRLEKINFGSTKNRADDIKEWIENNPNELYIIIDDDLSIHKLSGDIKKRWITTNPSIGFHRESLQAAFIILDI
jgi:hypothetical protein